MHLHKDLCIDLMSEEEYGALTDELTGDLILVNYAPSVLEVLIDLIFC